MPIGEGLGHAIVIQETKNWVKNDRFYSANFTHRNATWMLLGREEGLGTKAKICLKNDLFKWCAEKSV